MFRTPARDVHVHLWRAGSDDERRHLLFRDWLRESADDRARYETVKRDLAARQWDDSNDYADAKSDVVTEIMGRAETWASQTGWSRSGSRLTERARGSRRTVEDVEDRR